MMESGHELQVFYNGLMPKSKGIVNESARWLLKEKLVVEVHELFKKIAKNGCRSSNDKRMLLKKQARFFQVDASTNFGAQLAVVTHKMNICGRLK